MIRKIALAVGLLAAGGAHAQGPATSTVYASDYGVSGNIATPAATNHAGMDAAVAACAAMPGNSGKGCILQLPCGVINANGTFSFTFGIIVQGCGMGKDILPSGAIDYGGTLILQACTTCDWIDFVTQDSVQVRDIGYRGPLTGVAPFTSLSTAGCVIRLRPETVPGNFPNQHSIFARNHIYGGYNGMCFELSGNLTVESNWMNRYNGFGIKATNTAQLPDSGDSVFRDNTIGGSETSLDCLYLGTYGGIVSLVNKYIGCRIGINLYTADGLTGTLTSLGDRIEEVRINGIRVEYGGAKYGNIAIERVQFQNLATASFQGSIAIIGGPSGSYLHYCMIQNNQINNGLGAGTPFTGHAIYVGDCDQVDVSHNTVNGNNVPAYGGIAVAGNAANVAAESNRVIGSTPKYTLLQSTVLQDKKSGLTFGTLPGHPGAQDGSEAFITGVTPGSFPCAVGAGGAHARKANSSWDCR